MRVLIIGCGYVGLPLGKELAGQGHEVFGVRRSAGSESALKAAGVEPLVADISVAGDLAKLPAPFDWVVNCVSSSKGGLDDYRRVYLDGTRNLIEWLSPAPPRRFVYTGSTSVYGQTDGTSVDETSPTEPATETGQLLLQTEELLVHAAQTRGFPAVILRVAGIYGAGRGHLFQQFLKGEARIPGDGQRMINMIHREDLITAITAALKNGLPGEIYNVVDDEPVNQVHFFRWLSEALGKDMPPFVPETDAATRKRGLTNKRVQNRKLRMEVGCQLKFPNFRAGYTAEIERLAR